MKTRCYTKAEANLASAFALQKPKVSCVSKPCVVTPLFKKLNLKETCTGLVILNAPESFKPEMEAISRTTTLSEKLSSHKPAAFMMAFVTQQQQIDELAAQVVGALEKDGVLWFCYPKGSSKKYKCGLNRDSGWSVLGENGFEPVRMVAIDADWSALRFRQVAYIKKMTRNSALSKEGKIKAGLSPAE